MGAKFGTEAGSLVWSYPKTRYIFFILSSPTERASWEAELGFFLFDGRNYYVSIIVPLPTPS